MTLTQRLYGMVPLRTLPDDTVPPNTLGRFIWHFMRQVLPLLGLIMLLEAVAALMMALIPVHIGWMVKLLQHADPAAMQGHWNVFISAAVVVVVMTANATALWWVYDHVYTVQFGNMLRRQLHHYTLGHSLSYFSNDYAGRVANKVLESGPALREVLRSALGAVWYAGFYAASTLVILYQLGGVLVVPALLWMAVYVAILVTFVPQAQKLSMAHSAMHSTLVGRVVDTYTNILTVTLFARKPEEDRRGLDTLLQHTGTMRAANHAVWTMRSLIMTANAAMMIATGFLAVEGWRRGQVDVALVATALPLVWQLNNMSNWIMHEITAVFEGLGRIEECMETIAKPHLVTDRDDAVPLMVERGEIVFDNVSFHYGKGGGVMERLNLHIKPGQKVGLVGRSGAGKSTLVTLLLRGHDVEGGHIRIDGQDIAGVTQQSLREQMAVVTQDSALMNRSIADNIRLGRPGAPIEDVMQAAREAHSASFIEGLSDLKGNRGYDAQVGERGVKLSGGQRQRIGLARVFLKDAPILILDEATSALDSESEEAIQENLGALMEGKTVIAIAHRLATLKIMDRIIVMDEGAVVEDGTHAELLKRKGIYASLWAKQSGGFIQDDA